MDAQKTKARNFHVPLEPKRIWLLCIRIESSRRRRTGRELIILLWWWPHSFKMNENELLYLEVLFSSWECRSTLTLNKLILLEYLKGRSKYRRTIRGMLFRIEFPHQTPSRMSLQERNVVNVYWSWAPMVYGSLFLITFSMNGSNLLELNIDIPECWSPGSIVWDEL